MCCFVSTRLHVKTNDAFKQNKMHRETERKRGRVSEWMSEKERERESWRNRGNLITIIDFRNFEDTLCVCAGRISARIRATLIQRTCIQLYLIVLSEANREALILLLRDVLPVCEFAMMYLATRTPHRSQPLCHLIDKRPRSLHLPEDRASFTVFHPTANSQLQTYISYVFWKIHTLHFPEDLELDRHQGFPAEGIIRRHPTRASRRNSAFSWRVDLAISRKRASPQATKKLHIRRGIPVGSHDVIGTAVDVLVALVL